MIAWVAIAALSLAVLAVAALVLRLPREGWTLFASALVFGLAGYVWQGSPEQPSSPKAKQELAPQSGEAMVAARQSLFEQTAPKPDYLVTSDGFARKGQFGDAAGLLRRGLQDNPEHVEGWLALGMALVAHADGAVTPAARIAYDRASTVDPENPAPQFLLGAAYLQGRDFLQARTVWKGLLEKAPEDAPWREDLALRVAALDEAISQAPFLQSQMQQGQEASDQQQPEPAEAPRP